MNTPHAGAGALARLRAAVRRRLRLLPDWRAIAARSWSQRFIAAAVVLSGLEVGFGVFASAPPVPPRVFALLSAVTSGLAFWARLVAQKNLSGEPKP